MNVVHGLLADPRSSRKDGHKSGPDEDRMRQSDFSPFQLRLLFRLLSKPERSRALNLRSHNPVDVDLVIKAQACVDEVLGIAEDPIFRCTDTLRQATIKAMRNILAFHTKDTFISKGFLTGRDRVSLDYFCDYLRSISSASRICRLIPGSKFLKLAVYLLLRRLTSSCAPPAYGMMRLFTLTRRIFSSRPNKNGPEEQGIASADGRCVIVLTSAASQIVNYVVRSIGDYLRRNRLDAIMAFHDGFHPLNFPRRSNWKWAEDFRCVSLSPPIIGLSRRVSLIACAFQAIQLIWFACRQVWGSSAVDWTIKWRLLTRIPGVILNFSLSLRKVELLISQTRPLSVLSCDNGSENMYVKACAYACARSRIPFYRYRLMATFPVTQPAYSSIENTILTTSEDEKLYAQPGLECKLWSVGSPILDLAYPYVSRNGDGWLKHRDMEKSELNILFFTKRDFPNAEVISSIAETCGQNGILADITVKFHPSDFSKFVTNGFHDSGLVRLSYHGKDEIEVVDELISRADIVVSGSSNVIWSAFAQFKPVVYLAFEGMSSADHVEGYSRYATSGFVCVSDLRQIAGAVSSLSENVRTGQIETNHDHHRSLLRNFFGDGHFNSVERICALLTGSNERS